MKTGQVVVRKLWPFHIYDLEEAQSWLEAQAAAGWYLAGITFCVAKFRRGTPQKVRYRMEPSGDEDHPDTGKTETYAAYGWNWAATWAGKYHIYLSADDSSAELFSDSETLALAMKKRIRSELIGAVIEVGMAAGYFLILLYSQLKSEHPLWSLLDDGTLRMVYSYLLVTFLFFSGCLRLHHVMKLRGCVLGGRVENGDIQHRRCFRRRVLTFSGNMAILLLILSSPFWSFKAEKTTEVTDYGGALPFLLIQDLEDVKVESNGLRIRGKDWGNIIISSRDLLAPVKLELRQTCIAVEDRDQPYDTQYRPYYWIEYYEMVSENLAVQIADELEEKYPGGGDFERFALETPVGSRAIYYTDGEFQFLCLQLQKRAAMVCYSGKQNLREYSQSFLEKWQ